MLPRSSLAFLAVGPLAAAFLAPLAGCEQAPPLPIAPKIDALSHEAITVGETLYVSGRGFLPPSGGRTLLEFSGVFYWTDEAGRTIPEDVASFTIAPVFDGEFPEGGSAGALSVRPGDQVLRWNRFGPFLAPFGGDGRHPGLFKGTLTPVNVLPNGMADPGEPTTIALEVRPSVLITRLEPVTGEAPDGTAETAGCSAPALRVFGGIPYILEVETMGFEPAYFLYEVANINGDERFISFTHEAVGQIDRLGDPV